MTSPRSNPLLRILNTIVFSFKYLKNPWVVLQIPIKEGIEIILKDGQTINIKGRHLPSYIESFQHGWRYKKGFFTNKKYQVKSLLISGILEDFKKIYGHRALKGKAVLDIGGYCGETALFFLMEGGAKKVFVYEPVKEHFNVIFENINANNCKGRIIPYSIGVSNKNGFETINSKYPPGSVGFGIPGTTYTLKIYVESWNNILKRHSTDGIFLAKVDCEGGERHLLTADPKLVRQIPNWIIETHSTDTETQLISFFESLGYKKELREKYPGHINVWAFSRP